MCEPASFVLTKDRIFWSKRTDSHEQIIEEHGLAQDGARGPNIVRVEITPPNGNFTAPHAEWRFRVDQDLLPGWWDAKEGEARTRAELRAWITERVITGIREVRDAAVWALAGSHVEAYGSSHVRAYGSSHVRSYGSSHVRACDSSQVEAYGSSQVEAYDSSHVRACDSSQVEAYGSSHVEAYGSSQVEAYDSSHVRACDSSQVEAYGSSQVRACEQHATVRQYGVNDPPRPDGPMAVVIDCRGDKAICVAGE